MEKYDIEKKFSCKHQLKYEFGPICYPKQYSLKWILIFLYLMKNVYMKNKFNLI